LGLISTGLSAIGKLAVVGVLLVAFLVGMAGVVYMSLTGAEVKVPDITGKDFVESEKELASLGLRIKKRADRESADKINTVLEQLPKPGETVKTGQMILVVVSKVGTTGDEAPPSLKKDIDEDDSDKIEDMISDKPKKAKSNSNTNKKKADTTRDVIANTSTSTTNTGTPQTGTDSDKKDGATGDDAKKATQDKKDTTGPKTQNTPGSSKPNTIKPPAGEPRPRP